MSKKRLSNAELAAKLEKQWDDYYAELAKPKAPEPVIEVHVQAAPVKQAEPEPVKTEMQLNAELKKAEFDLGFHRKNLGKEWTDKQKQKIKRLKLDVKSAVSRERSEARAKAQAERLAAKLGEQEARRLKSQSVRLLEMLKEKPRTTVELASYFPRYGARVGELVTIGWDIRKTPLTGGTYLYTLHAPTSTPCEEHVGS
jgi:hypothetical protein